MLDRVLRDLTGVGGGAARDDDDLVDGLEHGLVDVHLVERELALGVEAAEQGVADGLRLIVDLLVHERGEAALLRRGGVPVDLELLTGDDLAGEVGDDDRVRGDGDDFVLADLDGGARVVDERGDVGAEEVLPSPRPMTSGELRRAATTVPGRSAWTASRVKAPSSRWAVTRIASVRSPHSR